MEPAEQLVPTLSKMLTTSQEKITNLYTKRNPDTILSPLKIKTQLNISDMPPPQTPKLRSPKKQLNLGSTARKKEEWPISSPIGTNSYLGLSPMPILSKKVRVQAEPEELWKQRRLRNQTTSKLKQTDSEKGGYKGVLQEGNSPKLKRELANELLRAQEQLLGKSNEITVVQIMPINTELYSELFMYKVYECYKPQTLKCARNYLHYLTSEDKVEFPELSHYLDQKIDTKFPNGFDQNKILRFDSIFECGNLDSAYLVAENKYTLLLKVDTNTRGGSHWFYFKVMNWRPGQTVEFKILNLVRNLQGFYSKGMNIYTRQENKKGTSQTQWTISDEVTQVLDLNEASPVVRFFNHQDDPPTPLSYYNQLSFRVKFPEVSRDLSGAGNSVFCFAYALPYGFTDLTRELKILQEKLVEEDGGRLTATANFQLVNFRQFQTGPIIDLVAQSRTRNPQFFSENNLNYNLTKQEQKVILAQTEEQLNKQTQLIDRIRKTSQIEINTDFLIYRREVISISVGGLNIDQLTITLQQLKGYPPICKRRVIYLQARMHAAENYGSFVMKNLIDELVTKPEQYKWALGHFIFKLIPMLNVDGVVIGNARSTLVGVDLNRRWKEPNAIMHPEIYFLKLIMMEQSQTKQGLSVFCDMHGHNKKPNCFFFGCSKANDEEAMVSWTKTRLLPKIFASNEPIFDYNSCRFTEDRDKQSTARVVVWKEMKVTNSFTLEISMFGKSYQDATAFNRIQNIYTQFISQDFFQIAQNFIKSIGQYIVVEKQLEKIEWLKPSLLKQITGLSARDKAANQKVQFKQNEMISKTQQRILLKKQSTNQVQFKAKDILKDLDEEQKQDQVSNFDSQNQRRKSLTRNYKTSLQVDSHSHTQDVSKKTSSNQIEYQSLSSAKNNSSVSSSYDSCDEIEFEQEPISWQNFFDPQEIKDGLLKVAESSSISEFDEAASDSQPSCDNFETDQFGDIFASQFDVSIKTSKKSRPIVVFPEQKIIKLYPMTSNLSPKQNKMHVPKNHVTPSKKTSRRVVYSNKTNSQHSDDSSDKKTYQIQTSIVKKDSRDQYKREQLKIELVTSGIQNHHSIQDNREEQKLNELKEFVSGLNNLKQRVHPTIKRLDSNFEKQIGTAPKEQGNHEVQIGNFNNSKKGYSFRHQLAMNQYLSLVGNGRKADLAQLQTAIQNMTSPKVLNHTSQHPAQLSRNQKRRVQNSQHVIQQEIQTIYKVESNRSFSNNQQQELFPLTPVQIRAKQIVLESASPVLKKNKFDVPEDFTLQQQKQTMHKFSEPKSQMPSKQVEITFDNETFSLQVNQNNCSTVIPLPKKSNQNCQKISNSITINNYYSVFSPTQKGQRNNKVQDLPQFFIPQEVNSTTNKGKRKDRAQALAVPQFKAPFEVRSLSNPKNQDQSKIEKPNLQSVVNKIKPKEPEYGQTSTKIDFLTQSEIQRSNFDFSAKKNDLRVSFNVKKKK